MRKNIEPKADLSSRFFRYEYRTVSSEGNWEQAHSHQGLEWLYVHRGNGKVQLGDHWWHIHDGAMLLFQPYQNHSVVMENLSAQPFVRTLLVVDPDMLTRVLEDFPGMADFVRSIRWGRLPSPVIILPESERNDFESRLRRMQEALKRLDDMPERQTEELMLFLLPMLRKMKRWIGNCMTECEDVPKTQSENLVEQLMSWIDQHYREPFSLTQLAKENHVSPSYASRLFKQQTGSTLRDFVLHRRILEACRQLTTTRTPIAIISSSLGFANVAYFCKCFKQYIGSTPNGYRKRGIPNTGTEEYRS